MDEQTTPQTPEKPKKEKKGKKRTRRIILVIVLLLLLLLGGIFAYRHFVGVQPNDTVLLEENIKAKLGQLEDKSNEEIEAALNEVVEEGTVCISINMNPVFSSGKAEGTLKIENGPMNLYMQPSLLLDNILVGYCLLLLSNGCLAQQFQGWLILL